MKKSLCVFGIFVLLLECLASSAAACNCGKKDSQGRPVASCQSQCGGSCGGQSACSEHPMLLAQKKEEPAGEKSGAQSVEAGNKICPVSGRKVGEMGEVVKHGYKGKIYNLCCTACVKDFEKNPRKYSKIAEREARKSEKQSQKETEREHHEIIKTHQRRHSH